MHARACMCAYERAWEGDSLLLFTHDGRFAAILVVLVRRSLFGTHKGRATFPNWKWPIAFHLLGLLLLMLVVVARLLFV